MKIGRAEASSIPGAFGLALHSLFDSYDFFYFARLLKLWVLEWRTEAEG